jgi:hypothetical protein
VFLFFVGYVGHLDQLAILAQTQRRIAFGLLLFPAGDGLIVQHPFPLQLALYLAVSGFVEQRLDAGAKRSPARPPTPENHRWGCHMGSQQNRPNVNSKMKT